MGRSLDVLLSGDVVGRLSEDGQGRVSFRTSEEYRQRVHRPVLSQSFEDDLLKVHRGRHGELPAFFANLAPEGPLRNLIESSYQIPASDDLALLEAVGGDLPGAVELRPGQDGFASDEEAEAESFPDTPEDHGQLRFSLAGVQLKFSVLREGEKLTLPASGWGGAWIVKLDSPHFSRLVENEYATLEWARAAGFPVPECYVEPTASLPPALQRLTDPEGQVLVIRRYDRIEGQRVHQEDFAQVTGLPPRLKYDHITYEQMASLILRTAGVAAYEDFVQRLAFVIASCNADAHLKNWSLVYPDGITAALSPLYDQVSTIAWQPEMKPVLALKFVGTKNLYKVDETSFVKLAAQVGADRDRTVSLLQRSLERIADAWASSGTSLMPEPHIAALREYWERAPLLKRHAAAIR